MSGLAHFSRPFFVQREGAAVGGGLEVGRAHRVETGPNISPLGFRDGPTDLGLATSWPSIRVSIGLKQMTKRLARKRPHVLEPRPSGERKKSVIFLGRVPGDRQIAVAMGLTQMAQATNWLDDSWRSLKLWSLRGHGRWSPGGCGHGGWGGGGPEGAFSFSPLSPAPIFALFCSFWVFLCELWSRFKAMTS